MDSGGLRDGERPHRIAVERKISVVPGDSPEAPKVSFSTFYIQQRKRSQVRWRIVTSEAISFWEAFSSVSIALIGGWLSCDLCSSKLSLSLSQSVQSVVVFTPGQRGSSYVSQELIID
jgi:hypothetical protein